MRRSQLTQKEEEEGKQAKEQRKKKRCKGINRDFVLKGFFCANQDHRINAIHVDYVAIAFLGLNSDSWRSPPKDTDLEVPLGFSPPLVDCL